MSNSLIKIELCCGSSKQKGYIGVDRFALEHVDIIADLNQKYPFENDYADVIFSCHGLEHLDDPCHTMEEIYRVGKHKSLVMILAPYDNTSLNQANFYHKAVFNEDSLRMFSSAATRLISEQDYECPHAIHWGVKNSDNSVCPAEFEILHMEYFYYESYRSLSLEQKRRARKSLRNVCDQIFYIAAINKSQNAFSEMELNQLVDAAKSETPAVIQYLRNRDQVYEERQTIYDDIVSPVINLQKLIADRLAARIDKADYQIQKLDFQQEAANQKIESLNETLLQSQEGSRLALLNLEEVWKQTISLKEKIFQEHLSKLENKFKNQNANHTQSFSALTQQMNEQYAQLNQLQMGIQQQQYLMLLSQRHIQANVLQLTRNTEKRWYSGKRYALYRKRFDFYDAISQSNKIFSDNVLLSCKNFKKNTALIPSITLPYETYFEYQIDGFGHFLHFYLLGNEGASVFAEVVKEGKIIGQQNIYLHGDGVYTVETNLPVTRVASLRLKILNNFSIVKALLTINRKCLVFQKKDIVVCINDDRTL